MARYITTTDRVSGCASFGPTTSVVTVASVHRTWRAAMRTGRQVLMLARHGDEPKTGDELALYHERCVSYAMRKTRETSS